MAKSEHKKYDQRYIRSENLIFNVELWVYGTTFCILKAIPLSRLFSQAVKQNSNNFGFLNILVLCCYLGQEYGEGGGRVRGRKVGLRNSGKILLSGTLFRR